MGYKVLTKPNISLQFDIFSIGLSQMVKYKVMVADIIMITKEVEEYDTWDG